MKAFIFCMRGNYNQKHTTRWSGYDAELIDMNVYTKHIFDHRMKKTFSFPVFRFVFLLYLKYL